MCKSHTLNDETQHNLSTIIKLLRCNIPLRIDQQRIVEQFPITDETIAKLIQMKLSH